MATQTIPDAGAGLKPTAALTRFKPARLNVAPTQNAQHTSARYGFLIAGIGLVIEPGVIGEVLRNVPVCRFPNAPDWFAGVINIRGTLVPVYNMKSLLGIDSQDQQSDQHEMVLVLGKGADAVGVTIDALSRSVEMYHKLNETPELHRELQSFVGDAWLFEDDVWFEFRHSEFFRHVVADLAA